MAADPQFVDVPSERRQIARRLVFTPSQVPYVNWSKVSEDRTFMGCDLDVATQPDGGLVVTFFWRQAAEPDRLRDAAPDMLAALIGFRSELRELWGDGVAGGRVTLSVSAECVDAMLAAIKRATLEAHS